MSQPPLSQQMKQLEEEIGVQLLDRTSRQVQLTEAGQAFLEQARVALAHAELAKRNAQAVKRGEQGTLIIGFVESSTYHILPSVLPNFRAEVPDVYVVLREMSSTQQALALRQHHIHVGFLRPQSPIKQDGLHVQVVMRESVMVALPSRHPLASQEVVSLVDMRDESIIMPYRVTEPAVYDLYIRIFHQAGFCPNVVQEVSQLSTGLGLIAAGVGISLAPTFLLSFQYEGVTYRHLTDVVPPSEIAVARCCGQCCKHVNPALARFLHCVTTMLT